MNIGKKDKIQILDGELPVLNKSEPQDIVDIFIVINEIIFINVEMNRSKFENVLEKNIKYKNKASSFIFEKRESIKQLKDMSMSGFTFHSWQKEKMDALYNELEEAIERKVKIRKRLKELKKIKYKYLKICLKKISIFKLSQK